LHQPLHSAAIPFSTQKPLKTCGFQWSIKL